MKQNTATKTKLFLDIDDTIIDSSIAVIDILNSRYGTNKTIADLKDWGYKTICPTITPEEVMSIFNSDLFFRKVCVKPDFLNFYNQFKNYIDITMVTYGCEENLRKKKQFIQNYIQCDYQGLLYSHNKKRTDKSKIDMRGGIQIDDRTDALLSTKADFKILYRGHNLLEYNRTPINTTNVYVVSSWAEICQIFQFGCEVFPRLFKVSK